MKSKNILVAYVIFLLVLQNIYGQTVQYTNDKIKKIDSIYTSMNNPKIAGGFVVAIIENDNIIYKKAFGLADVESNIPFTTSTVCDYGSIAKRL